MLLTAFSPPNRAHRTCFGITISLIPYLPPHLARAIFSGQIGRRFYLKHLQCGGQDPPTMNGTPVWSRSLVPAGVSVS
eukprot:COSAG02_NODE_2781_length_8038_cov_3.889533_7_plen_78_part_00